MQELAGSRRRGIRAAQWAKRMRLPRPHRDEQARAEALRERQREVVAMELRELARDAAQLPDELGRRCARQHAAHEHEQFAVAVEFTRQVFRFDARAKVTLDRTIRSPGKRAADE